VAHAVSIKSLTKTFGPKVAVNQLDLVVPEGSLYGFIGPNGAGKTTTIRMIMSIIFPDRGELSVLGRASAVESKDRIGYLPEERGIYRKMKAGPFLMYIARLKGVDSSGLEAKVKGWLDRMELGDCFKKRCEELSKGMQQKVQFVASIIHEPELIILDEPFSGLDPVNRRLLRSLIDEQHRAGRTIIFSTHAMFEAEQLCTHLFMINHGHKVLDLPLADVWRRYDPRIIHAEPLVAAAPVVGVVGVVGGGADPLGEFAFASEIPGVLSVEASGAGVDLRLADGADVSGIMSQMAARVGLRRIELRRPNLEDIFIELVGGDPVALRNELAGAEANGARMGASAQGVES
jgi:ABC-2 type transport system ATP-binding protein